MITTALPPTLPSGVTQEFTGWPSTWTRQAPHWVLPQPYLVPVRARWAPPGKDRRSVPKHCRSETRSEERCGIGGRPAGLTRRRRAAGTVAGAGCDLFTLMRIIPIIATGDLAISTLTTEHQTLKSISSHDRWRGPLASFARGIPESGRRRRWRLIARLAELSAEAAGEQAGQRDDPPRGTAAPGVARHEH
jgi:hypothetical protein